MCKGRGHNASKRPSPAPSPQPLAPGILSNFLGLLPLLLAEEFFRKLRPRLASPRRQQAPLKGKAASRSPESHRPAQPNEFRSLSSLSRPPSRCPVVGTAPFLAGGCGPRPAPVRGAPPVSSGLAGRARSAPQPLLSEAVVSGSGRLAGGGVAWIPEFSPRPCPVSSPLLGGALGSVCSRRRHLHQDPPQIAGS